MKYYSFNDTYVVRAKNRHRAQGKLISYLRRVGYSNLDPQGKNILCEIQLARDSTFPLGMETNLRGLSPCEESVIVEGFRGNLPRIRVARDIVKLPDIRFE